MRMKGPGLILVWFMAVSFSGCAVLEKARRADELEREMANLQSKLKEAEGQSKEKEQELSELERAKAELERSLKNEIGEYRAKLEMTERGLVITFLAEVFFDSGKDVIRTDGQEALSKVAEVLNNNVADSSVAVEGHTDNDPIKYSAWKSNWELSCSRALAVVHYLIEEGRVRAERLSANGYGEFRPVADNDTPEGKRKNRRVEIVILPGLSKVKAE